MDSSLLDSICSIVTTIRGYPKDTDRKEVHRILQDHSLERSPPWMTDFCRAMERVSDFIHVPMGYPNGENGLMNVLADIDQSICALGIDDKGEGWEWRVPQTKIQVSLTRETAGEHYLARIGMAE